MSSLLHHASPFHSLAPFSTVLPGGCLACDSRALHGAQLCLERHYAAFPLPNGTSFNSSHSLQENAADVGGLAIALQVTEVPKARVCSDQFFLHHPSCLHSCKAFYPFYLPTAQTYPTDPSFLGYPQIF